MSTDTTASSLEEHLSDLPTQARELVIEMLAEHAVLTRKASEREELLHAIAQLHSRCLKLHDAEISLHTHLGNLQVSASQLSSTLSHTDVFAIAQEIVTNLIGSEAVGIFELVGPELVLKSQFGIGDERARSIHLGVDLVSEVLRSGRSFFRIEAEQAPPQLSALTACVALRAGEVPVGLIVIFELLPHKPALTDTDYELLDMLGSLAGYALYCSRLHEELGDKASYEA